MQDGYSDNGWETFHGVGGSQASSHLPTSDDPITREAIARHLLLTSEDSISLCQGELLGGQGSFLDLPGWILPYEDELRRWGEKTTGLLKSGLSCPLDSQSIWAVPISNPDSSNRTCQLVLLACDPRLELVEGMRLTCFDPQEDRMIGTVSVFGPTALLSPGQAKALLSGAWTERKAWAGRISKPPHLDPWQD